ncbi:MAG: hypothetical protein ILO42_05150, partial [Clostridia bacterium]|nr:hypothetical protein [Clostridia bacterium]
MVKIINVYAVWAAIGCLLENVCSPRIIQTHCVRSDRDPGLPRQGHASHAASHGVARTGDG